MDENKKPEDMDTTPQAGEVPVEAGPSNFTNEEYKVKDGSVTVLGLGDSHLRSGHYFPEAYELARAKGQIDKRFGPLQRKVEWEDKKHGFDEGYNLSKEYKGQILDLINSSSGSATALFLSIGTNDLRKVKKPETVTNLLERFKALINQAETTPGVVLYLLDPVPCDEGVNGLRTTLSKKLFEACENLKKVQFVDLTHSKNAPIKRVNGELYQESLWADSKHLKAEGAELIVKALARAFQRTKSEVFLVDPQAREPRTEIQKELIRKAKEKEPKGKDKDSKLAGPSKSQPGRVEKKKDQIQKGKGKNPSNSSTKKVLDRLGPKPGRNRGSSRKDPKSGSRKEYPSGPIGSSNYYQSERERVLKEYHDKVKEIDRCEKDGTLPKWQGKSTSSTRTPHCRTYKEGPRRHQDDDEDDRGSKRRGGFSGFGGRGGGFTIRIEPDDGSSRRHRQGFR